MILIILIAILTTTLIIHVPYVYVYGRLNRNDETLYRILTKFSEKARINSINKDIIMFPTEDLKYSDRDIVIVRSCGLLAKYRIGSGWHQVRIGRFSKTHKILEKVYEEAFNKEIEHLNSI